MVSTRLLVISLNDVIAELRDTISTHHLGFNDPMEITHEVLLHGIGKQLDGLDGVTGSVLKDLRRRARNAASWTAKKERNRREAAPKWTGFLRGKEANASASLDPAKVAEERDFAQFIWEQVSLALDEESFFIVRGIFLEEKLQKEVARELSVAPSTVSRRLDRILQKLRRVFAELEREDL